jgi:hypothetical protein
MVLEAGLALQEGIPSQRFNDAALAAMGVSSDGHQSPRAKVAIGFADYGFDLLHPSLTDHLISEFVRWTFCKVSQN